MKMKRARGALKLLHQNKQATSHSQNRDVTRTGQLQESDILSASHDNPWPPMIFQPPKTRVLQGVKVKIEMSLPPERINIKRRRHDDPVEALRGSGSFVLFHATDQDPVLERAPGRDKKRRATDFVFKRLRADEYEDRPQVPRLPENLSRVRQEKQRSASQNDNSGIPQIRTTQPGDELRDMKALKAAMKSQVANEGTVGLTNASSNQQQDMSKATAPPQTSAIKAPTNARRFHLSRDQDFLAPSRIHAGVRKSLQRPKTHLATFVENALSHSGQNARISSKVAPIDRVIEAKTLDLPESSEAQKQVVTKHIFDQPFVKPPTDIAKTGHSIHSHPSTWNFDSDQLASELAAFAFEIDPTGDGEPVVLHSKSNFGAAEAGSASEDDYVYETYVRLPHNAAVQTEIEQKNLMANIGVLVIAEEDEELWEAYAESDSEDEWDEEDADSNGMFAQSSAWETNNLSSRRQSC